MRYSIMAQKTLPEPKIAVKAENNRISNRISLLAQRMVILSKHFNMLLIVTFCTKMP
jgi:hypothetical protein